MGKRRGDTRMTRSTGFIRTLLVLLTVTGCGVTGCGVGMPCSGDLPCLPFTFCKHEAGSCGDSDAIGVCTLMPDGCILVYAPVCGCDGETYGNSCMADSAGVNIDYGGECGGQVCSGIGGLPCEEGEFCRLEPGECCCDFQGVCTQIPDGCPEIFAPVCGCDGETYSNSCMADAARVSIDHEGECSEGGSGP